MRPCLIKQPAGIGDVFFCQKIARLMMMKGYDVVWPLKPDIQWIQNYIKDIWFPMTTDDFPMKDIYEHGAGAVVEEQAAFISTATADMTHNDGKIMSSKYSMLGLDTLIGKIGLDLIVILLKRTIYTIMYLVSMMTLSSCLSITFTMKEEIVN